MKKTDQAVHWDLTAFGALFLAALATWAFELVQFCHLLTAPAFNSLALLQ